MGLSYTGPATLFGRDHQAYYAPLIGADGKLTGALFVGVPEIVDADSAPETPLIRSRGDDFRAGAEAYEYCTAIQYFSALAPALPRRVLLDLNEDESMSLTGT